MVDNPIRPDDKKLTAAHWGAGWAHISNGRIISIDSHPDDPDPSPLSQNVVESLVGSARVRRPAIRKSWLDGSPTAAERGRDVFVEVGWDIALDAVAKEISRVRTTHGNQAIYAGSYGWASAGRFHHAQGQLKRFLNSVGGFTSSEGNYSYNAAWVMMPYIVCSFERHITEATRWSIVAKHSDLVVAFGGLASRNAQVSDGGIATHRMREGLQRCVSAGVHFVNVSPMRSDLDPSLAGEWIPAVPGSDTALMLALSYVLWSENLHDQAFLDRYCEGFQAFAEYLSGSVDGVPKSPEWAEQHTGIGPTQVYGLARRMAASRTLISVAAGIQRTDYGEQPLWMAVTLAAMLGQIGLPGGGYGIGYGVNGNIGTMERLFRWGSFPQGQNPVEDFIPVAMLSEMLLRPGAEYLYKGDKRALPNARLVWWAGGNPFHHHQDLLKLHRAFQKPETVIVNEMNWTATARHADIVLPVAAPQERRDFGAGKSDNALVPMHKLVEPIGEARTEFEIYCDLAKRLGCLETFSQGRDTEQWLKHMWAQTQEVAQAHGVELPHWEAFMASDVVKVPDPAPDKVFLADFRVDPDANPLPTPSGRIEIFSRTLEGFDLNDCKGHAAWFPPRDLEAGEGAFSLLSGQPQTRLHSQLDNGAYSMSRKVNGREPVIVHPVDAKREGICDGDVVEIFNSRGRCLAGARISDEIREGCLFLWTGAWWDPDYDAPQFRDRHGNPNCLTHDQRSSSLSQSPAAHSARVSIRRFEGELPEVTVHNPPLFVE